MTFYIIALIAVAIFIYAAVGIVTEAASAICRQGKGGINLVPHAAMMIVSGVVIAAYVLNPF